MHLEMNTTSFEMSSLEDIQGMLERDSEDDMGIPSLFENFRQTRVLKNALSYTPKDVVVKVYKIARILSNFLRKHDITFWTSGGTTLGIVRHGGLIPWDDDIDICISEEELPRLLRLRPELRSAGCDLCQSNSYVWKIFHLTDSISIENVEYRYPFCDVFIMKRHKKKYKCNANKSIVMMTNTLSLDVENREWRNFGDLSLPVPVHAEDYLTRTYGEDWAYMGATHNISHNSRDILTSERFELKDGQFLPALPFYKRRTT